MAAAAMHSWHRAVVVVTVINAALMLAFPPVLLAPLARGGALSFAGFQPFFALDGGATIFGELLTMELSYVAINGLAAWLAVGDPRANSVKTQYRTACLLLFAGVNLAVILLFPPFETYPEILRARTSGFDGFYFVLGDHSQRAIYHPLLNIEIIWLMVNGMCAALLLGATSRTVRPAGSADPVQQYRPHTAEPRAPELSGELGRRRRSVLRRDVGHPAGDRRSPAADDYPGTEKRLGNDRRRRPR